MKLEKSYQKLFKMFVSNPETAIPQPVFPQSH